MEKKWKRFDRDGARKTNLVLSFKMCLCVHSTLHRLHALVPVRVHIDKKHDIFVLAQGIFSTSFVRSFVNKINMNDESKNSSNGIIRMGSEAFFCPLITSHRSARWNMSIEYIDCAFAVDLEWKNVQNVAANYLYEARFDEIGNTAKHLPTTTQ